MKYYMLKEGMTGYGNMYEYNTPYREDYTGVQYWKDRYPNDWEEVFNFKFGKGYIYE